MTEYELIVVQKAVERSLVLGAPGVSQVTRQAIVNRVLLRLRHEFNIATPKASQQLANLKAAFAENDIPWPAALTAPQREDK